MADHICREGTSCICYSLALEPDGDCPVHGFPFPPRCCECGRFMSWEVRREENERFLEVYGEQGDDV